MSSALPAKRAGNNTVINGTVPDDAQRLRAEIEQTRENLGATVEQLAARIDIKSRAQAEAAQLADRIKDAAAQLQQDAPGYARRAIDQGTKTGREQRVPLAVAAGVVVVASLVIWQLRRR